MPRWGTCAHPQDQPQSCPPSVEGDLLWDKRAVARAERKKALHSIGPGRPPPSSHPDQAATTGCLFTVDLGPGGQSVHSTRRLGSSSSMSSSKPSISLCEKSRHLHSGLDLEVLQVSPSSSRTPSYPTGRGLHDGLADAQGAPRPRTCSPESPERTPDDRQSLRQ